MTAQERVRICRLAEKVYNDKTYAEKIYVTDKSHYIDSKQNGNNKRSNLIR